MRTEGKNAQAELEDLRQTAARVEAEKVLLVERVEVEAAERVMTVSSITHERDFLLKQASFQRGRAFYCPPSCARDGLSGEAWFGALLFVFSVLGTHYRR